MNRPMKIHVPNNLTATTAVLTIIADTMATS